MERTPIESSMLNSYGYDFETKTLEVEFKNGDLYQYAGVPQDLYAEMAKAPSAGKFFSANVRGRFAHQKLEQVQP
jgi:hypothetical protein